MKYYELQEAWEQSKSTSVLSVPIPAVRTYESASIADTPPALEETASDPTSHVCPVLHSLHGAVGMVTVGLATEDIDLDGRCDLLTITFGSKLYRSMMFCACNGVFVRQYIRCCLEHLFAPIALPAMA